MEQMKITAGLIQQELQEYLWDECIKKRCVGV